MKKKFIILILFLSNIAIAQTTRYVSVNGNDTNSGSISAPYQTIQYAIPQCTIGDLIKVNPGVFVDPRDIN